MSNILALFEHMWAWMLALWCEHPQHFLDVYANHTCQHTNTVAGQCYIRPASKGRSFVKFGLDPTVIVLNTHQSMISCCLWGLFLNKLAVFHRDVIKWETCVICWSNKVTVVSCSKGLVWTRTNRQTCTKYRFLQFGLCLLAQIPAFQSILHVSQEQCSF